VLEVENLTVVYQKVISVLYGLSLMARDGSITAILGSNGSGKTTLMRAISGILSIYEGQIIEGKIELNKTRLNSLSPIDISKKMKLTYLLEGRPIFEYLTVTENLKAASYGRWDEKVPHDMEDIFEYFPALRGRSRSKAGYLSGGEQQMLCIGMALMTKSEFFLLDEPSIGLAPILIKELFDIIIKIHQEKKNSILLCEQNALAALNICSYGYVVETGRVVLDGPADELIDNEDIRESYLGGTTEGLKDYKESKRYKRRKRWL
jgi:branched-chain amino acid transport system ATP-binding protein